MATTERLLAEEFRRTGVSIAAAIQEQLRNASAGPRSAFLDYCIELLSNNCPLPDEDASRAFEELLCGEVAGDQIGALLVALRPEWLLASNIAAFAKVLRNHVTAVRPHLGEGEVLGDTCGTGSDTFGTFNVSTTIMFVLAAGGVHIAKHGNRAVTSRCGSADVLEELGTRLVLSSTAVEQCIQEVGIGFMFAPEFHRALKHLQPIRKILADEMDDVTQRRTIFNVLGPLANPADANRQIIGVYSPDLVPKFAEVLKILGLKRALVVYGRCDGLEVGLDEFSTLGTSVVAELKDGVISEWEFTPEDASVPRPRNHDVLKGDDKKYNARILRAILDGTDDQDRMNLALLNAGAGLYLAEKASTIRDGVAVARELIAQGAATRKLQAFVHKSNQLANGW